MTAARESEEPKRFGFLRKHNLCLLLCLLLGKYSVIYLQLATEVQEVLVVWMLCNAKKKKRIGSRAKSKYYFT